MHQVRHFSLFNASATYTSMFGTLISRTRVVSEGDTWCAAGRHLQSGKSLKELLTLYHVMRRLGLIAR